MLILALRGYKFEPRLVLAYKIAILHIKRLANSAKIGFTVELYKRVDVLKKVYISEIVNP